MSELYLGTIGWSYNFWLGKFYPTKTAPKDYLHYYATHFSTVEVDSSFYRIPTQQMVQNWKAQVPEGFKFSLKFPQLITHIKMLKGTDAETDVFLERVKLLGEKLGALLLQFPPSFAASHFADLEAYLSKLPKTLRYVVEVRHKSWLNKDFYDLLRRLGVALAWADSPLMRETREVTADFLYMRWEGDRAAVNGTLGKVEVDRASDLQTWAATLKPYLPKTPMFGYFAKYYSGYPPSDIELFSKLVPTKPLGRTPSLASFN
ncbi:MAG: DUF72 domain-containing protein [Candidatus Bathyarchaeota archaeon]|nr:DUF72 domain-containing protein [Candidatus Bathyarchaeota archaeon]